MKYALIGIALLVSISVEAMSTDRLAEVNGYCFLQDQNDHSGSKVLFTAESPSAVTDSIYTNLDGSFSLGLDEGMYSISYSHEDFIPFSFPDLVEIFTELQLPDVTLTGPGTLVSGNVSGYWGQDEDNYFVVGDVEVAIGDSLYIAPGTRVIFADDYDFIVRGYLEAVGTAVDSVVFTSAELEPSPGDWGTLIFNRYSDWPPPYNDGAGLLKHCVIEYGSTNLSIQGFPDSAEDLDIENSSIRFSSDKGIYLSGTNVRVIDCLIQYCESEGVEIDWDATLTDSRIEHNSIGVKYNGSSVVSGNEILANESDGMVVEFLGSTGAIEGNLINGNGSSGIRVENTSSSGIPIENNWIANNLQGVVSHEGLRLYRNVIALNTYVAISEYSNEESEILFNTIYGCSTGVMVKGAMDRVMGNIIVSNGVGIESVSAGAQPDADYNEFWSNTVDFEGDQAPGIGEIVTTNANGDSCDTYFNIFLDPRFVDVSDFELLADSPCIDAGNPDPEYHDPDGTIADIGAKPFFQGNPLPPEIDFTPSTNSGHSPLSVEFTSTNTGGPIFTWLWDFGDDSTSSRFDPVHTYSTDAPIIYTVSLYVEGPGGSDYVEFPDLIELLPAEYPPIADFTADPLTGFGFVQFEDRSSGVIDAYSWDFGDGIGTSSEANPNYDYSEPGTYSVSLMVSGSYGSDEEVKFDYINILDPEIVIASFDASPDIGVVPANIQFTNTSMGTISSYLWNFGDESTSEDEHPAHIYLEAGEFEITLIATGPANADTAFATIEVLAPEAQILSIEDVPEDQGLQVYLTFKRSGYDSNGPRNAELYSIERKDAEIWTTVLSGAAYGQDIYQYIVPTLIDSTSGGNGLAEFRVIAAMDEGNFISDSSWGFSVDNIAPGPPGGFQVYSSEASNYLSWDVSEEPDFQYFRIYGGMFPNFEVSEDNLLHTTANLNWVDIEHMPEFYKISTVDDSGNEGPAVLAEETTDAPSDIPDRFSLFPCVPNPFNPSTTIRFTLPTSAKVNLEVIDMQGRRVASLLTGESLDAGLHEAQWWGRDDSGNSVSSGVYLYRLTAGGHSQSRKLTLLK